MMLQILSKKFFKGDDYYITKEKSIIYSNIRFFNKIVTDIAVIEPIETYNGITSYLLQFDNVLEKQASTKFQLVSVGKSEIIEELIACYSFWFKGIFSTDKDFIEKLLRKEKSNVCDEYIPQKVVPYIFKRDVYINQDYSKEFSIFIKGLIGISNEKYIKVIAAIRQFKDSIITINYNLELAYTMMVATIESLATKFDEYKTTWEDCFINNEKSRKKLDEIFDGIDSVVADNIKKIIIDDTHAKLSMRFQQFVLSFISDQYYLDDAKDIEYPCKESQLKNAIKNSYQLRSSYVHALREIPELLKIESNTEVYVDENKCFFTFLGLIRLSRYVIIQFIDKQEKLEKEEIDYLRKLPGMVTVKMVSEYWIWKEDKFSLSNAKDYYQGLLEYISKGEYVSKGFIDLNKVCEKIEKIIKGVGNDKQKVPLVCFYLAYNYLIKEELRNKNWSKFEELFEKVINIPCMENAILYIVVGGKMPWSLVEIEHIFNNYDHARYNKSTVRIPNILEICLLLEMVNLSLSEENTNLASKFLKKAFRERPQDIFLRDLVQKSKNEEKIENIEWYSKYILRK